MSSDRTESSRIDARHRRLDWRVWLAMGWAIWFGTLYVRMVLIERAPGLARWLGQSGGP